MYIYVYIYIYIYIYIYVCVYVYIATHVTGFVKRVLTHYMHLILFLQYVKAYITSFVSKPLEKLKFSVIFSYVQCYCYINYRNIIVKTVIMKISYFNILPRVYVRTCGCLNCYLVYLLMLCSGEYYSLVLKFSHFWLHYHSHR